MGDFTPEFLEQLINGLAAAITNNKPQFIYDKRHPTFDIDKPVQWDRWIENLETSFSDTDDDILKKKILLHNNGDARLFDLIADLLKSKDKAVQEASFEDIKIALKSYFSPKISAAAAYAKFINIKQLTGETILQYVARLRAAAAMCEFKAPALDTSGTKTIGEKILLWQFIYGIANPQVQQYLLNSEDKLVFQTAIERATTAEYTANNIIAMTRTEYSYQTPINATYSTTTHTVPSYSYPTHTYAQYQHNDQQTQRRGCYRCNGPHHSSKCTVDISTLYCKKCSSEGHNDAACRGRKSSMPYMQIQQHRNKQQNKVNIPPATSVPMHQMSSMASFQQQPQHISAASYDSSTSTNKTPFVQMANPTTSHQQLQYYADAQPTHNFNINNDMHAQASTILNSQSTQNTQLDFHQGFL